MTLHLTNKISHMDCTCAVLAAPSPTRGSRRIHTWRRQWSGGTYGSWFRMPSSHVRKPAILSCAGSGGVNGLWSRPGKSAAYIEDLTKAQVCAEDVVVSPASPSAEALQNEFGCDGVRFLDVADLTVVELKLRSGATSRIVLPGAQITSYKPLMWHGGYEELLHSVLRRGEDDQVDSTPEIRGGIGLLFSREDAPAGSLFSLTGRHSWQVEGVLCDLENSAQIIFSCHHRWKSSNQDDGALSFRYVVTLSQTSLSSGLVVFNSGLAPVTFTGGVVNHIGVNEVVGVLGTGLKGSRYQSHPFPADQIEDPKWPLVWGLRKEERASNTWEMETSQDVKLHIGMNKLFKDLSNMALVDRGKRRMVIIRGIGFQDFHLSNPGVEFETEFMRFEKNEFNEFVCLGPAQAFQPVVLRPGEQWRAAQVMEHN